MCRSIKVLRRPTARATPDEVSAAALQFVRKVSGFQKPSRLNQAAFDDAVREIADATHRLLENLSAARSTRTSQDEKQPEQPQGSTANFS
jgi:hypothetical protein